MKLVFLFGFTAMVAAAPAFADDFSLMPEPRPSGSAPYLVLGGQPLGALRSASGGNLRGVVVVSPSGPRRPRDKRIGTVKIEDLELQLSMAVGKPMFDWINASWNLDFQRKDGSVVACDFNLNAKSEREFFRALVAEVGFPACDGASKEAGYLSVKLAPEQVRDKKGSGKCGSGGPERQRNWLRSNFRLELRGIDATRVMKIDAFTVRPVRTESGEPTANDVSNLKITLSAAGAESWEKWADDTLARGEPAEKTEREGAIVMLAPDMKTELGRVNLHGVGIVSLEASPQAAGQDRVPTLEAELYVEGVELISGN